MQQNPVINDKMSKINAKWKFLLNKISIILIMFYLSSNAMNFQIYGYGENDLKSDKLDRLIK